jgi:hypothetical protein
MPDATPTRVVALVSSAIVLGLFLWLRESRRSLPTNASSVSEQKPVMNAPPAASELPALVPGAAESRGRRTDTSVSSPPAEEDFWHDLSLLNRTDKPRALVLAERGEGWYSDHGPAAEARRAMIVTLLVDLGQMDEARARARAFIQAYPQSAYRPLVQGKTGIHPRPYGPYGVER